MSRREFTSSKRGNQPSDLEPSTLKRRAESPENPPKLRKAIFENPETEFSEDESDISDNEYDEVEMPSEPEYEEGDDYALEEDALEKCQKKDYRNNWKDESTPVEEFEAEPIQRKSPKFESEEEAFSSIISARIKEIVIENTNLWLRRYKDRLRKKGHKVPVDSTDECPRHLRDTDEKEIRALMGLWLKLGITGFDSTGVEQIFALRSSSSLDAHLCFSKHRYRILMRAVRFDDPRKRNKEDNKLAAIQDILDLFRENIQANYEPGEYLTVDEILLEFKGRCSFRMYIPSKHYKYGIKIFCVVDPETMYMVNLDVYKGKESGRKKEKDVGKRIVMELTSKYQRKGRTIVADNFFTSSVLGMALWEQLTYLLGTLKKKRSENPEDFMKEDIDEEGKVKYVFRDFETIAKYQAKKSKEVFLYSTKHRVPKRHRRTGKPKMITDYNGTKFGVDIFDQMICRYSYMPRVRRWPLRLFMFLVNAAALNALKLYGNIERREFIHRLADQLMHDQIQHQNTSNHSYMYPIWQKISGIFEWLESKHKGQKPSEIGWCYICNKVGRDENILSCSNCEKLICKNHAHMLCLCDGCNIVRKSPSPKREEMGEVQVVPQVQEKRETPTTSRQLRSAVKGVFENKEGPCGVCSIRHSKYCLRCQKPFCRTHMMDKKEHRCG